MWKPTLPEGNVRFRTIVDVLSRDIENGTLRAGDRLPPQRELAFALGVNLSTVSRAYQEAARRHLIGGEVGRGTYVLASSSEAKLFALKQSSRRSIDLSTNVPAPLEDDDVLVETMTRIGAAERRDITRYHRPELIERSRKAIVSWLQWRGLEERPKTIVPCAGAHAALQALLLEKTRPGDPVLVESFTFPGMKVLAKQLRLRLIPVETDIDGVIPEALEAAIGGSAARIAVLVPNLQNPTGAVMNDRRRREIAAIVERENVVVVEDDAYGSFAGRPPLARDLGGRGIVVSSLSKTVMPGLRFGFVAGSDEALEALHEGLHLTSWLMSPWSMLVGSTWIEDGTAFERADRQRAIIAERWERMVKVLGPSGQIPSPHVWLRVDDDAETAASRCHEKGVEVVAADLFASGRKTVPRIRACLTAAETLEDLDVALAVLAEIGARP